MKRRADVVGDHQAAHAETAVHGWSGCGGAASLERREGGRAEGQREGEEQGGVSVAGHATLDAWAAALAQAAPPPDAVLIGCFGDPGLMALRESSPVPVTGLAEAAFIEAARHGRFAIVTGGERWAPILQRLAQSLGHASGLAGIHTVAPTGAQLAADPIAARRLLTQACLDAVRQLSVQTVILGGAGLAGMAAGIWPLATACAR